jgi:hypothetical protein
VHIIRNFFLIGQQQQDIRHVYERYVAKSDPHTLMVSTPNAPNQLFESIEKEPEERYTYIIETIEERGG